MISYFPKFLKKIFGWVPFIEADKLHTHCNIRYHDTSLVHNQNALYFKTITSRNLYKLQRL